MDLGAIGFDPLGVVGSVGLVEVPLGCAVGSAPREGWLAEGED